MADPKVGPADPETVHRLLQQRQAEDAKGDKTYQRPAPEPQNPQTQGVPITGKDRLNAIDTILERMKDGSHHG
jgi:hypothetical protein